MGLTAGGTGEQLPSCHLSPAFWILGIVSWREHLWLRVVCHLWFWGKTVLFKDILYGQLNPGDMAGMGIGGLRKNLAATCYCILESKLDQKNKEADAIKKKKKNSWAQKHIPEFTA